MKYLSDELSQGFKQAQKITRLHDKTFYYASLFLPQKKRLAAYTIYAVCRITGDIVARGNQETMRRQLQEMQENIKNAFANTPLSSSLLKAFRHTVMFYDIPYKYFEDLIEGMYMNITKNRYNTFQELYTYCNNVGGVIGLIMLSIFKTSHPQTQTYAVQLGIAMQLTNILRNIDEDFQRGRIYLPQEDLHNFAIKESFFRERKVTAPFKALMRFQIGRAREFYDQASLGIPLLEDARCRFVVTLMKNHYAQILVKIERQDYNIFYRRPAVTLKQKSFRIVKLFFKNYFS